MELRTIASYVRELRPTLPRDIFKPATSRLLWLPTNVGLIVAAAVVMARGIAPMWTWPLLSLAIGVAFSGIAFLAHETMHGAIIRGRRAIHAVGWIGFVSVWLSPTLWTAWHNRVHHNHCGQPGIDPDMYPTLHEYQTQSGARIMADHFGIGRNRVMGLLSLPFGFTGQSLQMLFTAGKRGFLSATLHRRAIIETSLGIAMWAVVVFLVGPLAFVFVYLLPLLVVNSIVMAFINTNHNLSPLTPVNDPLVNSLSVTLPRPLEFITLDFGFHVEHHLFPTMSTRHGRVLREALRERWPDRYQSMPMTEAMARLYHTARVYRDDTTLIDPPTGLTWPTLGARVYTRPEAHAPEHAEQFD